MTLKEFKAFVKLMQKEGVASLKLPDVEIVLAPHAYNSKRGRHSIKAVPDAVETPDAYTQDDILYWSSSQAQEA